MAAPQDLSALHAAMQNALQQQQQQHEAALAAMQAQLAAMAQQQQQQSPSPPPVAVPGGGPTAPPVRLLQGPRMPAPPAYDGSAAQLDGWLNELQRQFRYYEYASDAQKLHLATAFLSGAAHDWHTHLAAQPTSWAAFVAGLRQRFQPVTSAQTARNELDALRQGNSPVNDFIAAFRRLLVLVPDMSEADRLHRFLHGLRPGIAAHLRVHGINRMDAAIEMAARIGALGEQTQSAPSSGATGAHSNPAHVPMEVDVLGIEGLEQETSASSGAEGDTASKNAPVTRAEFQQLLNALQQHRSAPTKGGGGSSRPQQRRGPPQIPHLTPVQVQEYMAAGKCFGCGSKEHQSRQCEKRKVGADGRVSWTK
jgi:hypothetical protein